MAAFPSSALSAVLFVQFIFPLSLDCTAEFRTAMDFLETRGVEGEEEVCAVCDEPAVPAVPTRVAIKSSSGMTSSFSVRFYE